MTCALVQGCVGGEECRSRRCASQARGSGARGTQGEAFSARTLCEEQGWGPSFRLKNLLIDPGCVPIKVFDTRVGTEMWFERELIPWFHYIPVEYKNDSVALHSDLRKVWQWLEQNLTRAEEIAKNGAEYGRDCKRLQRAFQ